MWFTLRQSVIPKNALRTKIWTAMKQIRSLGHYVNLKGIMENITVKKKFIKNC